MLGIPNTIFKGTAGPGGDKPGPDSAIARSVFLAFLAVCFPVAMLTHTAWLLAFYRGRMKWWVPAVFLGVWLPVTVLAGGFRAGAFADAFISPWNEVFAAPDGLGSIVSGWFGLWAAQFFLGVLFGSMYSSVSCAWKWARRPQWKEQKIKPGPFLKWRYRKSAAAIAEGSNTAGQSGGVTIGVAADRRDGRYAGGDPGEEYGRVPLDQLPVTADTPLNPMSPYAESKVAADHLCAQYHRGHGLAVVRLRAFNQLGPGQDPRFVLPSICKQIADAEMEGDGTCRLELGNIDTRRDFLDVRDVVRAYALLLEKGDPSQVYLAATGQSHAIGDLVDIAIAQARIPVQVTSDPSRVREGEQPDLYASPRALEELGWVPRIPLEQSIRDALDYWRDRAHMEVD